MKTKYLYIYLLGLLSIIAITGCEDRLNILKQGNLGAEDGFYKTDEDTEQALANLYYSLHDMYFNWYFTKNLLADDVWTGGGSRGDNSSMERLNEYNFGTDHAMVEQLYASMYTVIYNANLIIGKIEMDTDIKKRAVSEAKFFRAWAHFELVTMFGTAPVVDHLLEPSEYRQGNGNPETTWAFIEKDLNDAIASGSLPSKNDVNDKETGIRITKEVAQAYLGKAQLFQGKYSEAAVTLDKVIESGKYDLYQNGFDMLLHAVADNNCESMLEIQMRNDPEKIWDVFTMTHIMQGWRTDKLNYSSDIKTYIASGTYGFVNPRKELYDAFVAMEGKDGYRLNCTMRTYAQMKEAGITLQSGAYLYGSEGYFMWKNRPLKEDCVMDFSAFQALQYTNLRIMRYAEVLLMAAEAHVQGGGSQTKALKYINEVRTRAHLPILSTVSLDDIKKEKRLELCLEDVRYQDLIRWGDASTVLAEQGKDIPSFSEAGIEYLNHNTVYGFTDKNKLLPIPAKELLVNPNMAQNKGW
ncbi:RagB/SusD family nutrient uptake outer membrane protein [uncultured Bacteroides sp.]|uniref:RagB/SusD family nutrient uptake outer membrane protein n=1 Tax=uncultured Bacteroides sp. TaxID=162156 RepID=UPI002AAAADAB|nr:RagB/SusD family nutrient uptake outer membrane protein [uncultured Bacteroides sp.]